MIMAAPNVSYQIANLLEKMGSADKDYRFMATNDLMAELQKDAMSLDDDSERKVVKMLLKLLEDKNGEVQNLAVKCLGPLVNKVKEGQVDMIVDSLCMYLNSDNDHLRDVSSIALKTVVAQLPPGNNKLTATVTRRIVPRVTNAVSSGDCNKPSDVSVVLEGLDIIADILLRFGGILQQYHTQVKEALVPQLESPRLAIRKRAIAALSNLVSVCSTTLFEEIINVLLEDVESMESISTKRTFVGAIAAVSRASGHRFGEYLPRVVPMLIQFCSTIDDEELRESCFQAFEAFATRSPREVDPFMDQIVSMCTIYLSYDPNYDYSIDDFGDGQMEIDEEEDEDEDGAEYSDDDDISWKVRRAVAKCLEALVLSRLDRLGDFYDKVGLLLISRFKEREENVKADIFHAYSALLRQTRLALPSTSNSSGGLSLNASQNGNGMDTGDVHAFTSDQADVVSHLREQIPLLVKNINKQLRDKSPKTKLCCFNLLSELMRVIPGALTNHLHLVMPGVEYSMIDKHSNSTMKIVTLQFVGGAVSTHPPNVFHAHMAVLVPVVTNAVHDSFYKVSAEALGVLQSLARVLRPIENPSCDVDFTPYVKNMYDAVFVKLKATDIDQEVKEKAISCAGQLLASFGDYLKNELPSTLPLLYERLKNEMTRLTTVRAMITVAKSPLHIKMDAIVPQVLQLLGEFLRKNQRALKLASLGLLDALVLQHSSALPQDILSSVLTQLPPLIQESDLQIAQIALKLLVDVLDTMPSVVSVCVGEIVARLVVLVHSSLLQGTSLKAVLQFLTKLLNTNVPNAPPFEKLVSALTMGVGEGKGQLAKQATVSMAQCVATLVAARPKNANQLIDSLFKDLTNVHKGGHEGLHLYSLLTIGEIGRRCPEALAGKKPEQIILQAFNSPSEEIKTSASYSLGALAVGNLEQYVPFILSEIEAEPKRQYLLLHALKEVISSESESSSAAQSIFANRVSHIWKVLVAHAQCTEEGTRNVVAECLGKLCLQDPQVLLPKLKGLLVDGAAHVRATAVTAVKFTIVDQPQAVDPMLKQCMGEFILLDDHDLNVRRVALITFNSAAHNKPSLVRDLLQHLLPKLYHETLIRKELVREVEMGPFKHQVDDGLDLRKAAFECMYTLLETCLERIDIFEFIAHLEGGLKDHYDINLLTYLMVARVCVLCPRQVIQKLDRLCEPLKQTLLRKVKANAVKQEFEKQEELKRSALRTVLALQHVSDADKSAPLIELMGLVKSTPELHALYASVEKDAMNNLHRNDNHIMDIDH